MKEWFKYFGEVFSKALCRVLKSVFRVVAGCLTGVTIILSFAGTDLCIFHLLTGEGSVPGWLYASPVIFILTLALFETYLNW